MSRALALVALGWAGVATAAPPAPAEAEARAFIERLDDAERAGDVAAIGAALAPDCRIELRDTTAGRAHLSSLTRDEYLAELADYYASLHDLAGHAAHAEPVRLEAAATPGATLAVRQVIESYEVDGVRHAFRIEQSATLERRDGRLWVTRLARDSRPD